MSATVFMGGSPTAPDVAKLHEAFGIPTEGTLITWDAFEKAVGIIQNTHRFRTVLNAWRKAMFTKHNVVFGPQPGKGLIALAPNPRIERMTERARSGFRIIRKATIVAGATDRTRLTPENRKAAEHLDRIGANHRLAAAAAAKGIRLPELDAV